MFALSPRQLRYKKKSRKCNRSTSASRHYDSMAQGGIGPPPSRCKREGLPLAYWAIKKLKKLSLKICCKLINWAIWVNLLIKTLAKPYTFCCQIIINQISIEFTSSKSGYLKSQKLFKSGEFRKNSPKLLLITFKYN